MSSSISNVRNVLGPSAPAVDSGPLFQSSEEPYRLLADGLSGIAVRTSLDLRRESVSPACQRLLGYEPEEWIGRPVADTVHLDEAGADLLRTLRAVASGEAERGAVVYRLRHKQKHWIWVEEIFGPVRDAHGHVASIISVIRDVSERLRQADELRLAKETAERALAEAQQASRSKTEFLAAMSHEIRTPLNAILGFTSLLVEDNSLNPESRRKLDIIQSSGAALLTIVNDILDFSKIEAGQIDLDPRPFDLTALVEEALAITRGLADEKGLVIRATIDAPPHRVVGDPDRLRQVLLNLLNNAVKFTPRGSVTLTLRREAAAGPSERLRFAVMDTGIGIAEERQARLFQRFSQADGSIRRAFGGTGLGLAIARQLAVLMGGEIGFESALGQGSTFWFTLTLPAGLEQVVAPDPARCMEPSAPASGRILLAEDLEINQELVKAVLTRAGYRVETASDGAEAVMAVQSGAYDLALMDVQMPVMDGIAATERIRHLPGPERHIPIIAMTANVLPEQIDQLKAVGMNAHVGKPFQKQELLETVSRWLARSMSAQRLEDTPGGSAIPDAPGPSSLLEQPAFSDLVGLVGRDRALAISDRLAQDQNGRRGAEAPDAPVRQRPITNAAGPSARDVALGPVPDLRHAVQDACRVGAELGSYLERANIARKTVLSEVDALEAAHSRRTQGSKGSARNVEGRQPNRNLPEGASSEKVVSASLMSLATASHEPDRESL